jgi:hypothetical protein
MSEMIDTKKLYKMAFIYNCVMDGWIVKKDENDKIICLKDKENVQEYQYNDFLKEFVKTKIDIDKICLE